MAEEMKNQDDQVAGVETTNRGMFDFLGKKKDEVDHDAKPSDHHQEEAISSQFEQKVHVSEPPHYKEADEEEVKKGSLLEKLHRSSSSSSSSSEEEVEEGGEKRRKKKDKKKKDKKEEEDTTVPVEKCDDDAVLVPEEKKGFMDKIKEKLPGHGKKEEVAAGGAGHPVPTCHPPHATESAAEKQAEDAAASGGEKKGFLEKIKEKLPGYHPKTTTAEEEKGKDKESH